MMLTTSEKAMATHSSTLAWKIPWTEEPGRLQSMGSQRVGHDWVTSLSCIGEENGNPLQCSAWRIPRTGEPGGPPSMGLHRVGHDWSNLAAAATTYLMTFSQVLHVPDVPSASQSHRTCGITYNTYTAPVRVPAQTGASHGFMYLWVFTLWASARHHMRSSWYHLPHRFFKSYR